MGLLDARVIIVTGAAQEGGIGEAIARRCHEEGAHVVVTSRSGKDAEAACGRLPQGPRHAPTPLEVDLTDEAAALRAAREVLETHGHVDGIVHNAGYPLTDWGRSFLDIPIDEYARVFDVDVVGALRLTKHLLPGMVARRRGALVFTSSGAAVAGWSDLHEFSAAKAGVLGIMRNLAQEFGPHNVRANAVAYGNIRSEATFGPLDDDEKDSLAADAAMKRWGETREAADACVFLLSDMASFVTGQTLIVDGGAVMR